MWKKTGLDSQVPIVAVNLDPRSEATRKDQQKMAKLFQDVPRDLLVRIYQKYQPDFELFDYDFDKILAMAGYEPLSASEREIKPVN